jgi:hypothetical protein
MAEALALFQCVSLVFGTLFEVVMGWMGDDDGDDDDSHSVSSSSTSSSSDEAAHAILRRVGSSVASRSTQDSESTRLPPYEPRGESRPAIQPELATDPSPPCLRQIFVRGLQKNSLVLDLASGPETPGDPQVDQIYAQASLRTGIPREYITLTYAGQLLVPGTQASIPDNATLHERLRPTGPDRWGTIIVQDLEATDRTIRIQIDSWNGSEKLSDFLCRALENDHSYTEGSFCLRHEQTKLERVGHDLRSRKPLSEPLAVFSLRHVISQGPLPEPLDDRLSRNGLIFITVYITFGQVLDRYTWQKGDRLVLRRITTDIGKRYKLRSSARRKLETVRVFRDLPDHEPVVEERFDGSWSAYREKGCEL